MRRTLFGKSPELKRLSPTRVSAGEALLFDIRDHEASTDQTLIDRRVSSWGFAPWLLLTGHLIIGMSLLLQSRPPASSSTLAAVFVLLGLSLAVDVLAGVVLVYWRRLHLAPHTVARLMCGYLGATGLLSALSSVASGSLGLREASFVTLAMAAGFFVRSIAAVAAPPLAIVNAAVAAVTTFFFSANPLVTFVINALAVTMVIYSIAVTQKAIGGGRRRLSLEWEAQKALNFVDEFENSGRGWFWETDSRGTLSYVSRQLAEDFQCEPQELLGRQFTDLLSVDSHHADSVEERKTLGFHLSARFPFSDVVVRPASEQDVHWSLSGNPIFDDRGRFMGFRGIGTDLTEQRRSEQEISRLARFDSLTGLPNRAMMRQTLEEALRNAAHRHKGCSLFLIDLDRFKNVNDTLGHPVGDALLRQVAERLKSVMGNHGQVGRLGGDEFESVLPGSVDIGLLESLARTLIEQVSRPYVIEGHKVTIGASVGIAIGDPGRSCADRLVRNADLALYAAKAAGRGKHCFYEPSMHSEAAERQLLEDDRGAIDRGELWVAYQPIVHAAGEEISGFEALVRWNHATRGEISPDRFVPLAEECGLIGKIGEWVLETALAEAARWPDHVRIAVNLSPIQFNDPGIVELVQALLKRNGLRAERLELEITEGVFLAEGNSTDETFAKLKALGVRLALDDFGTGYSSLGYLKKAPFDKIKIDQSFVRGAAAVSSTNRNAAIIRAIVTLAETLDMDTCAEGVETHDDLQLIRELGVSMVQGYIFGRPSPADTARELANAVTVEADGYQCIREPRHRLIRRAIALIDDERVEVKLRNISSMGALAECPFPVSPGMTLTIDIVGVGPVRGTVRWAQSGKFGIQFGEQFDLSRLAFKKEAGNEVTMLKPWYVGDRRAGGGERQA